MPRAAPLTSVWSWRSFEREEEAVMACDVVALKRHGQQAVLTLPASTCAPASARGLLCSAQTAS